MNQTLFVYGTLLQPLPTRIGRYLRDNSELLGDAYAPGRLYDLGDYPGLWYDAASTKRIYGQALRLRQPEAAFEILDQYEGIDPARPEQNEYRREAITTTLNGRPTRCWCYILNHPPDGLPEIFGGNYLKYLEGSERHRDFLSRF